MSLQDDPGTRFQDFLRSFSEEGAEKYRRRLAQTAVTQALSILIDFTDLITHDSELARLTLQKPDEYLPILDAAALGQLRIEDPEYADQIKKLNVRFRGLPDRYRVRDVASKSVGELIEVEGIIVRSTNVKPLLVRAVFQCRKCTSPTHIDQTGATMRGPGVCPECRSKVFEFREKDSIFVNSQDIRIQERPEDLPAGQLPRIMDATLLEDLCDTARPGDRASVVGVPRAIQEIAASKTRLRTFNVILAANNVDVVGKEVQVVDITEEEELRIREMAADPFIVGRLTNSIAPSIYGYSDIKEAILYLLMGGVGKVMADGVKIRGEINEILVGDPSLAKSQLLQYVARIAPRGLYTSGRGSSAAGLTAAVLREKTGGMILEAGALVLADRGVCMVDEIDKMRPEDRIAIHETLEQHSYHPFTEILLASGRKVRIGEFVDELFERYGADKLIGNNCEILPVTKQGIFLISTPDFRRFQTMNVSRVSRHTAPDWFVGITYSNGRTVMVTPNHPVFVYRENGITTIAASTVKINDFIPGVRQLEALHGLANLTSQRDHHPLEKDVALPGVVTENLGGALGYLITEGWAYKGSTAEIGFANTDGEIINEMRELMRSTFGLTPCLQQCAPCHERKPARTKQITRLRYLSSRLHRYCSMNFSAMMQRAPRKRVPSSIMGAPLDTVQSFLSSAFKGDGGVETTAVCFSTSSEGLAEDYQDLLLRFGISTRLTKYGRYCKVYVTGDSLSDFVRIILDRNDPRYAKVMRLVERSRPERGHDVAPTQICDRIIGLKKMLGIRNEGCFYRHQLRGDGVTRAVLDKHLLVIDAALHGLERTISSRPTIRSLRVQLGWSQNECAKRLGLRRGNVEYCERGGYSSERRTNILNMLMKEALCVLRSARNEAEALTSFKDSGIRWLRVRKVSIVPNHGQNRARWSYDLTVDPTHNFVSHGVVLHNTVSIAKGGIVTTLNARTAVLAAANPALGRYNPYKTIADNINLPTTLLSRFDLYFIMRDIPDATLDGEMAEHILTLHRLRSSPEEPPITPSMLRKYIAFAKRIDPVLTKEAADEIKKYYMKMRAQSASSESPIAIAPRQLEALVRLAEARARCALKQLVDADDARSIIRLMTLSLQEVGIDTETGKMDIDIIMTGKSRNQSEKMQTALELIRELEKESGAAEQNLFTQKLADKLRLTDPEIHTLITVLEKEGLIFRPKIGYLRRTAI